MLTSPDIQARGEDDATPLHYAARYRGIPRSSSLTPRPTPKPTPQVSPFGSTENLSSSDTGISLKREEKKKEAGGSASLSKATKDRLLGSLTKKRESLGTKLFKDLQHGDKKNSSIQQSTLSNGDSMISFLLSQKADVNACDNYGSTPLHYAVARGNPLAVAELLTHIGIDIEVKCSAIVSYSFFLYDHLEKERKRENK